jgi:hypothetical protein
MMKNHGTTHPYEGLVWSLHTTFTSQRARLPIELYGKGASA